MLEDVTLYDHLSFPSFISYISRLKRNNNICAKLETHEKIKLDSNCDDLSVPNLITINTEEQVTNSKKTKSSKKPNSEYKLMLLSKVVFTPLIRTLTLLQFRSVSCVCILFIFSDCERETLCVCVNVYENSNYTTHMMLLETS